MEFDYVRPSEQMQIEGPVLTTEGQEKGRLRPTSQGK